MAGIVIGLLGELALSSAGNAMVIPPLSLPITLATLALILVLVAIPIRRSLVGKSKKPINPFSAVRVVAAAKASALAGGLFAGLGTGVLFYLFTRTISPPIDSWVSVIATAVGGIILLIAGLVVEHLCVLPPTDDDETTETIDQPA
nr:DUF3180 domain-containing protein [Lysinibacter cavernae]